MRDRTHEMGTSCRRFVCTNTVKIEPRLTFENEKTNYGHIQSLANVVWWILQASYSYSGKCMCIV